MSFGNGDHALLQSCFIVQRTKINEGKCFNFLFDQGAKEEWVEEWIGMIVGQGSSCQQVCGGTVVQCSSNMFVLCVYYLKNVYVTECVYILIYGLYFFYCCREHIHDIHDVFACWHCCSLEDPDTPKLSLQTFKVLTIKLSSFNVNLNIKIQYF